MNDNEYFPPLFTNVDWNNETIDTFIPLEYDEQKLAIPSFQRRRSSSVDLPINPFYLNTMPDYGLFSTPFNHHIQSNNDMLSEQQEHTYRQHQKRRRSSSLPPVFHNKQKPTPLIFTQIQVADPTPTQHIQKIPKIDSKPIAIERVVKKPQIKKPVVECDPVEKQKKLDNELIQLNFDDVTVAELKEMLKERGLSNTGKKAVLTERLKQLRNQIPTIQQSMANMTIDSPQCLLDNVNINDVISFEWDPTELV